MDSFPNGLYSPHTLESVCWYQPGLWDLLPKKYAPSPPCRIWPEFMQGCVKYRRSFDVQTPDAPRISSANRKAPAVKLERDGIAKRLIYVVGVRQGRVYDLLLHQLNGLVLHLV